MLLHEVHVLFNFLLHHPADQRPHETNLTKPNSQSVLCIGQKLNIRNVRQHFRKLTNVCNCAKDCLFGV